MALDPRIMVQSPHGPIYTQFKVEGCADQLPFQLPYSPTDATAPWLSLPQEECGCSTIHSRPPIHSDNRGCKPPSLRRVLASRIGTPDLADTRQAPKPFGHPLSLWIQIYQPGVESEIFRRLELAASFPRANCISLPPSSIAPSPFHGRSFP